MPAVSPINKYTSNIFFIKVDIFLNQRYLDMRNVLNSINIRFQVLNYNNQHTKT